MKRFTDSAKWDKAWFQSLPSKYKNLWDYLYCKCDNSGVWSKNMKEASFKIGEEIDEEEALKLFNDKKERVQVIDNGEKWFIIDFIDFQFPNLNPNSNLYKNVSNLLRKHGISKKGFDRVSVGYPKGLRYPTSKGISISISKGIKEKDTKEKPIKEKFSYKSFPEADNPEFKGYLQSVYPSVNVEVEFRRMESWLLTNPRKTYKNYGKFCRGWIDRASKSFQNDFVRHPAEKEPTYEQVPVPMTEDERKKAQEELAKRVKEIAEAKKL